MVFAHPTRYKGNERQPEKKVEISPQDLAIDNFGRMKEVMMIVPINASIDKT